MEQANKQGDLVTLWTPQHCRSGTDAQSRVARACSKNARTYGRKG